MCLSRTHQSITDVEDLFDTLKECVDELLLIQKEKKDELKHRFYRLLSVCHHGHHKKHHTTSVHVHVHNSHHTGGAQSECCCEYEGSTLPGSLTAGMTGYSNIDIYGTSCSAWDGMAGTPLTDDCPPGADFSSEKFSSCARPWCYVSSGCADGTSSKMFASLKYSYDICSDYQSVDLDDRRKIIKKVVQELAAESSTSLTTDAIKSELAKQLSGTWEVTSDSKVWSEAKVSLWYLVKIPSQEGKEQQLLYIYPAMKD